MNEELKAAEKRYREYGIALSAWQAGNGEQPHYDEMPEDTCALADFAGTLLDGQLIDEPWLKSIGFKGDFHKHGPGMWLPETDLKCNWEFQWHYKYEPKQWMTRGELRFFCMANSITLQEPTEGTR